ncbi:MAG: alpha/beta fold hydrolase [Phycisphaerae bacterium]|nr:alpha/beta fold hydrolase [Phycisphaerae bacterium]
MQRPADNYSHPRTPRPDRLLEIAPRVRLHYVDEGQGPTVVMVHGNPTWSFMYRNLIAELRSTHRCIAPDHIGCGLSDKPDDSRYAYWLENRVADLETLIDRLAPDGPITWVVHDWGGMIGLTAALRRFERIDRVVLLNTSGFFKPRSKRLPRSIRLASTGNMLARFLVQGCNAFARGAAYWGSIRGLPHDVRRGYLAPYDSWSNRRATLRFVQDIPIDPSHPSYELTAWTDSQVARLNEKPVLICWGRRDFVFDDHFLNEWRRRLPKAELHVFENAGHYVIEDAREELIPLAARFIREGVSPS